MLEKGYLKGMAYISVMSCTDYLQSIIVKHRINIMLSKYKYMYFFVKCT